MENAKKSLGEKIKRGFRNISTLVNAFVFAVFIWLVVTFFNYPDVTQSVSQINVDIPTEISQSLIITNKDDIPKTVSAQISGKRYEVGNIAAKDLTAFIDVSDIKEAGEYKLLISVEPGSNVRCDITKVYNNEVTLIVKEIISKTFTFNSDGDSSKNTLIPDISKLSVPEDEGFKIIDNDIIITPASVTITGEKDFINSVNKIKAVPKLDGVSMLNSSQELEAEYQLVDENNVVKDSNDFTFDRSSCKISVAVHKEKEIAINVGIITPRYFADCFDKVGLLNKMYLSPETITISSANISAIESTDNLTVAQLQLSEINESMLKNGKTIKVELPSGFYTQSGEDFIKITFDSVSDYQYSEINLTEENIAKNVQSTIGDVDIEFPRQKITIRVLGPSEYLESLTAEDITLIPGLEDIDTSEGTKKISASYKINGSKVPCWITDYRFGDDRFVSGNPQVSVRVK